MKTRYYCKGDEECGCPCIIHAPKHDIILEIPTQCAYSNVDKGYWKKQIRVDGKWVDELVGFVIF